MTAGRLVREGHCPTMLDQLPRPDVTLNCIGLYCPEPIIRTANQAREMKPGQILEVQATDPGFQIDLPAWCLCHRHEFLGMDQEGTVYTGYVRLEGRAKPTNHER
jgi:TusA-related sulfurtransferase